MPRTYTVEFENQSVTNANGDADLFEFLAATDKPIELYGLFLAVTSEVTSNVAEDEFLRLRIIRGHTTSGNGTATTARPVDPADAAASFTAEVYGATIASAGTAVNLHSDAFNVRTGFQWWAPEGAGWRTSGTSLLVVRLMAGPADDVTMNGTAYVREL